MADRQKRKSEAARRANQVIRIRTIVLMLALGVVVFGLLFAKLYELQIERHEELEEKAVAQQTRSTVVTASRGTIYDRNGNALAISASAETVCISPKDIASFVKSQQEKVEAGELAAGEAKDEDYIARGLARILDREVEDVRAMMEKTNYQYTEVKKRVEQDVADEVRRFINGEIDDQGNVVAVADEEGKLKLISDPERSPTKLTGCIFLEPDTKRYYPYNTLAAQIVGFVNNSNEGAYGLEAKYEDLLQGTSGMTVSSKTNTGDPLLYPYEQIFDAQDGSSLVLTLDTNIQYYLEKGMESMVEKFDAANGAAGIVMDVNTGAILGMASIPTFDLNDYSAIYDTTLQEKLDASLAEIEAKRASYADEKAYDDAVAAAYAEARGTQWRNRTITDTYEPGSTFKPITLATALEEGIVTMNTTFNCSGSIMVPGWSKPFNCSRSAGHGLQTLKVATGNSCNPAFISMGLKIGTDTYWDYINAFGLRELTGIDVPGEVNSIFASESSFKSNVVSLASYAFGQTFNVTPIQVIRAQAATINGGYLYTPYLVDQVLDGEGNIVSQHESTPIRQVVSEETSALVRECLEYVVAEGTGKNGQVAGYRIGGKTGTADKTGTKTASNPKGDIVVSFMCFAPADDPQVIMLLTMDTPSRTTGTYPSGGNMVAPTASAIMSEILPYLGIQPDYTAAEMVGVDTTVPNVVDMELENARTKLTDLGFSVRTVGDGSTVTDQTPVGGAIVPSNATIVLYLGAEKSTDLCTVPNVVGLTASEANTAMTNAGLIMKVTGATTSSSGNVYALSQDQPEGKQLEAGSVVTVQLGVRGSGAD